MKMTDKEKIKNDDMDVSGRKERIWSIGLINITIKIKDQKAEEVEDYSKALADKSKECEDLKAQIETYSKMLETPEFKVALTDIRTGEREMWRNLGNKAQRYKKALDEIEEYIYNNTDFDINDSIQSKTAGYDILQIIKDV